VRVESHGGCGGGDCGGNCGSGDDDSVWGKLLTHTLELSGNPTRRYIWERVERTDKGVRISHISNLWYVNGSLTCRRILRHGASGFASYSN
jgi:hypothetical protein